MDYMDNYQLSDNIIITYIAYERSNFCLQVRRKTGAPECHLIEHTRSVTRSLPAHVIRLPRCIPGCSQSISPIVS